MATDQAPNIYIDVENLIRSGRLREAFSALTRSSALLSDTKTRDLLKRLEETYRYLIHYLVEGYEDEGRERMLADIRSSLFFINETAKRNMIVADSPDIYSSTHRLEKVRKATLQTRMAEYRKNASMASLAREAGGNPQIQKDADDALSALFMYVWTMFGSSSSDYADLKAMVSGEDVLFAAKAQIISALLLGALAFYDRKSLECLIDIFESDPEPRLAARALIGIVMIIAAHPERVADDRALANRLSLWGDSIIIYRQLREVVMGIIRAHDTERITHKMKNEVIPELMKLRPEILDRLRSSSEATDLESLEMNPEWEDILNKNGLGEKLKELTEIQMEGGDVMMMAFSNLKSFPFFNNISNWFLPYFPDHSELASDTSGSKTMFGEILDMEGVMCDSDKYSFALSLSRMPEAQSRMLAEKMGEQMAQFKEMMSSRKLKSSVPEFDTEVTRYVRDLYRFFKLFRKKDDFVDPFAHPLDFGSLPFISDILADIEILSLVGEFYFKRGYFKEALPILLRLEKENPEDIQVWEKIGYCYHSLEDYRSALAWYRKAELINPDSAWLVKSMATCFRVLGQFEDAAEYFGKALAKDPENCTLLEATGFCQLKADDIEGALANYYHSEYVNPGRISTWRGIAWSELLKGNYPKCMAYYDKILTSPECTGSDMLNSGHACYLTGDRKGAVERYGKAARFNGYGLETLEKELAEDIEMLTKHGGDEKELSLMLEKVRYDIG